MSSSISDFADIAPKSINHVPPEFQVNSESRGHESFKLIHQLLLNS